MPSPTPPETNLQPRFGPVSWGQAPVIRRPGGSKGRGQALCLPATRSGHRRFAFLLHTVRHLVGGDLFESQTRWLMVVTHHPSGGAAVDLTRALAGERHEQVAVGHFVERLLQRRKGHQLRPSRLASVKARYSLSVYGSPIRTTRLTL